MECNKDESLRAKEIAERKFSGNDIVGARRFALKAQSLYPGLDGIQQLVATLDVYICAKNKIGGEADWYGILGVDPEADDESLKKQYRKLVLSLHPDKNKSLGADGAFKLLKDAWELLSDKAKRVSYDRRTNVKVRQNVVHQNASTSSRASQGSNGPDHQKVSTAQGPKGAKCSAHQKASTANLDGSSATTTKSRTSNAKGQSATKRAASFFAPAFDESISQSFWSECPKCRMQFEYLGKCGSFNVWCINCNKLFLAAEIVPPATCDSKSSTPSYTGSSTQASVNVGETSFISHVSFTGSSVIWSPFSRAVDPYEAAKTARVHPQASSRAAVPSKPAKAARVEPQAFARAADPSTSAKAASEGKRTSRKWRKANLDPDTLGRVREDIARNLNDEENKKKFDARKKKGFEASRKEG